MLNQELQSDTICRNVFQIIRLGSVNSILHLNFFRLLILGTYTYENNNENYSFLVAVLEYNSTRFCHY
jgi:hypothetical protein